VEGKGFLEREERGELDIGQTVASCWNWRRKGREPSWTLSARLNDAERDAWAFAPIWKDQPNQVTYDFRPAKREIHAADHRQHRRERQRQDIFAVRAGDRPCLSGSVNAAELNKIIKREGKNRIVSIDTERGRALHYAPPPGQQAGPMEAGRSDVRVRPCLLEPPFSPRLIKVMVEAADEAGYRVIILDSGSHEWAAKAASWKCTKPNNGDGHAQGELWQQPEGEQKEPGWKELEAVKMTAWIKPKMAA
jgi:hypothetical protein